MSTLTWNQDLAKSYDRVAGRYAEQHFNELRKKPFDCALLHRLARTAPAGSICDLGCGPGHIGRYLRTCGRAILGIDLSSGMLDCARRLNPSISYAQGDMLNLPCGDQSLAGIACFDAVIHMERSLAKSALDQMLRALIPNGKLLLAFHGGEREIHMESLLNEKVSIDATFFQPEEMTLYLKEAGFAVDDVFTRDPYQFERENQRVYIFASKKVVA